MSKIVKKCQTYIFDIFRTIFARHQFSGPFGRENRMGAFRKGGFSNNRFVLKPDVAIASEVSILSKNSLAITDVHAKKTQHVQLFENPKLLK